MNITVFWDLMSCSLVESLPWRWRQHVPPQR